MARRMFTRIKNISMKKIIGVLVVVVIILAATFLVLQILEKPQDAKPAATVIVDDNGFTPTEVTIKKGQTVRFVNRGKNFHWPASNPHPTHDIYPEFDPKIPIPSGKFWSFEFDRVGQWGYHDHLVPYHTGTITV